MSYVKKFSVPFFDPLLTYNKFDLVRGNTGSFYYVSAKNNNNDAPNLSGSTSSWKVFGDYNFLFNDIWVPSYETSVNNEPRVLSSNISSSYVDFVRPDGKNTVLMNWELKFERRSVAEIKSLLAFFDYMDGKYMFRYFLPEPYNTTINFICKQWNVSFISWEEQSLLAILEQRTSPFVFQGQNGTGQPLFV